VKKRIELRSNFARWFSCIASTHEKSIRDLRKQLSYRKPEEVEKIRELQEKIREHQAIVDYNREEQRRYNLTALICGNEVLTIR
jgi:hypothetical protein